MADIASLASPVRLPLLCSGLLAVLLPRAAKATAMLPSGSRSAVQPSALNANNFLIGAPHDYAATRFGTAAIIPLRPKPSQAQTPPAVHHRSMPAAFFLRDFRPCVCDTLSAGKTLRKKTSYARRCDCRFCLRRPSQGLRDDCSRTERERVPFSDRAEPCGVQVHCGSHDPRRRCSADWSPWCEPIDMVGRHVRCAAAHRAEHLSSVGSLGRSSVAGSAQPGRTASPLPPSVFLPVCAARPRPSVSPLLFRSRRWALALLAPEIIAALPLAPYAGGGLRAAGSPSPLQTSATLAP